MAPSVEAWFRELEGDERLEVFVRVEGMPGVENCKLRASGPERYVYEAVDQFEAFTGLQIGSNARRWRRQRTGPKPMEGQTTLFIGERPTVELSSRDATVDSNGSMS